MQIQTTYINPKYHSLLQEAFKTVMQRSCVLRCLMAAEMNPSDLAFCLCQEGVTNRAESLINHTTPPQEERVLQNMIHPNR